MKESVKKRKKFNQIKKRFVILNKIYKKLLPKQRKHISFMFDYGQREMEYQLRITAEQRKKRKEKAKLNS